jgi:outer membrane murein-binding lipoprotein Lpp
MRHVLVCAAVVLGSSLLCGCTADVQQTDDATRVTVETPKVETSGQKPDLDPTTDDDVDVDTPLPGDR